MKLFLEALGKQAYTEADAKRMGPLKLAYLGDVVYEMYIRLLSMSSESNKPKELNVATVKYAKATSQAKAVNALSEILNEEEWELVKWGRNQKTGSSPKNTSVQEYRLATGLETLIGFLYLSGRHDRLDSLMARIIEVIDSE